jgi:urease subunit alpha
MFGTMGKAVHATSVTFVSKAAQASGGLHHLGLQKTLCAVSNTRTISKADMKLNDYQPVLEVDPQTYVVKADGQELTCEPAEVLPLAQRYYLF